MKKLLYSTAIAALALTAILPAPAAAQNFQPGLNITDSNPQPVKLQCWNGSAFVACSLSGGSGGGGGAVTAASGAFVAGSIVDLSSGGLIDTDIKALLKAGQTINVKLLDASGAALGTSGNPVYVSGGSGGGGGGAVTAVAGAYASGAIVDLGTGATPAANTVNSNLINIYTRLGTPLQAGGTVTVSNFPATQAISATALPLPTGAATQTTLAQLLTNLGSPVQAGGKIDTAIATAETDIGVSIAATTATQLAAASASRRGFSFQNQTTGSCWINVITAATGTYHDLLIASGAYYESKDSHVGTGAISAYCTVAGGINARQW